MCPCKGCDKRTETCHAVCADHAAWKILHERRKEEAYKKKGEYISLFKADTRYTGFVPKDKERRRRKSV